MNVEMEVINKNIRTNVIKLIEKEGFKVVDEANVDEFCEFYNLYADENEIVDENIKYFEISVPSLQFLNFEYIVNNDLDYVCVNKIEKQFFFNIRLFNEYKDEMLERGIIEVLR